MKVKTPIRTNSVANPASKMPIIGNLKTGLLVLIPMANLFHETKQRCFAAWRHLLFVLLRKLRYARWGRIKENQFVVLVATWTYGYSISRYAGLEYQFRSLGFGISP